MSIKNIKGFTLAEIMVALGILSFLTLVIMRGQQAAMQSTSDLKSTSEMNNLIQLLAGELSRVDTCSANFATKTITRTSIGSITTKNGADIIKRMSSYGDISIDEISSALVAGKGVAGAGTGGTQMQLTVKYLPAIKGSTLKSFVIPITVFTTDGTLTATSTIKSCYSDVRALLETAVQNACDTTSSVYTSGSGSTLGTCNSDFAVKDSTNNPVGSTVISATVKQYICPAGEFLQKVTLAGTSPGWTFKCVTATTGGCPPWQYLAGFDTSTGAADCRDIRNISSYAGVNGSWKSNNAGIMVIQSGTYQLVSLSCPANQILQGIAANGSPNCIDPRETLTCPVGKFLISINYGPPMTPNCGYVTTPTACGAGSFLTDINNDGSVGCKSGTLSNCTSSQYISGIDATAQATCVNMP